ncbi:MAG: hypothetical protein ACLFQB_13685 [Chitinispirillaceae bacterium]
MASMVDLLSDLDVTVFSGKKKARYSDIKLVGAEENGQSVFVEEGDFISELPENKSEKGLLSAGLGTSGIRPIQIFRKGNVPFSLPVISQDPVFTRSFFSNAFHYNQRVAEVFDGPPLVLPSIQENVHFTREKNPQRIVFRQNFQISYCKII